MLKGLNNIPIFRRIFIAFAIATIIPGIVVVLLGTFYLNAINVRDQAVHASFQAQSTAFEQQASLQRMNAFLQAYMAQVFASGNVGDPSMGASAQFIGREIVDREVTFGLTLTSYQQNYVVATAPNMSGIRNILLSDDPNTGIIQQQQQVMNNVVQQQWPAYKTLQDQELTILQNLQNTPAGQNASIAQEYTNAYAILFKADQAFLNLNNSWQQLVTQAQTMGEVVTTVGPSQTNPIIVATVIAFLATILVVIAIGTIINATITQPLRYLAAITRRISKGDTSARANIGGKDEIYQVAVLMNGMLDNIVKLAQDAQERRAVLEAQINKLMSDVGGVGEGDLRIQAEVSLADLGVLADSINFMVEELSGLIIRVKRVAREVKNSTLMTVGRMGQMVKSADVQIRSISEAAVEVERMADASRSVAERSEQLTRMARDARLTVNSGRTAVQQTVTGIGQIQGTVVSTAEKVQALDERSQAITDIVTVIDGIAHQTNRLALDASVQAAMAGENGKGFAAVAADIRRLAELSKEQVSMIAQIVRNVREDISSAAASMRDATSKTTANTRLAHETSTALESIFAVIDRQASEIEAINRAATQQLQSSGTVVQVMQNVSELTQQSSRSTYETTEQMRRLAYLAEQLLSSVEAFKVREEEDRLAASNRNMLEAGYPPSRNGVNGPAVANTPMIQAGRGNGNGNGNGNGYDAGFSRSRQPQPTPVPTPFSTSGLRNRNGNGNGNGNGQSNMGMPPSQPFGQQPTPQEPMPDRRPGLRPARWQSGSNPSQNDGTPRP